MTIVGENDLVTAAVADQFDRFPFPDVDHGSTEGLALLRRLKAWLDTRPRASRILDVGCGTGHTTLAIARHLPRTEIVGVDIAAESIARARALARDEGLDRVSFVHADARSLPDSLGRFDVVMSLGVLHHVPDFETSLEQILSVLYPDGHLVLWLYGRYGRAAHRLNQRFLQLISADTDTMDERITAARALLREGDGRFVSGSGVFTPQGAGERGVSWLLEHSSWLVDQFLPVYERAFTLEEVLPILYSRGLKLDRWFGMPDDLSHCVQDPVLRGRLSALAPYARMVAVECLVRPSYYLISGSRNGLHRGGPL